ncbi:D-aminoacyl-tRNA deacylase [Allofustis seminis]|uniref:D-aminoacyl-tRNA deacylase n=1 Tax=Allofustis seminis TaxID=166939 RepID=UPI0003796A71|nr:D-aminoacyl-tRNA deacylase [Allofustis seminis]
MRVIIQRVSRASVSVQEEVIGAIQKGFMILVGVEDDDNDQDVLYLARKISNMRIFDDEEGKMNRSLKDVGGSVLSISQFTLHAQTKKGNRPSFIDAAAPEYANKLYEQLNECIRAEGITVEEGKFGANMQVALVNDGPVTIWLDSKNK